MAARQAFPFLLAVAVLVMASCAVASAAQFEDISSASNMPRATGVAWGDYDGDGYSDLFVAGTPFGSEPHGPMLYRNNHDLTFTEVGQTSLGLPTEVIEQDGPGWADYDNDGDLDLLVTSGGRWPYLYRRDAAEFAELGEAAGFKLGGSSRQLAWCDYDGDNLLDVFVPINGQDSYLYHNNGDGTFTDVHAAAGIFTYAYYDEGGGVGGQSAAWGNYDNDGLPDLLISRVRGDAMLYRNNGDGTFTDVSAVAGIDIAFDCFSAIWGDYDNDGWLDCYFTTSSYTLPADRRDYLFHNNRDGTFTEVGLAAGMGADVTVGFGAGWGDYDNDGYLDLYVANWGSTGPFLYHNNHNGTFTNVLVGSGMEGIYHNLGAAWADIDLDGRIDLVQGTSDDAGSGPGDATRLFHNTGTAGNWLRLRALTNATGAATLSEFPARDAIGVRVDLNLDNDDSFPSGRTLARIIGGGAGHAAQGELVAHFGLGTAALVAVRVLFPDGSVVVHRAVPADQQIVIKDVPADRTEIFDDVPLDYWAYPQIRAVKEADIAAGYPEGVYQPTWPVTRDQMAVYISRALAGGDANVPDGPTEATFDDVPTNYWAYKYVEYAVANKVVEGYDPVTYAPEVDVSRDQMAVFVARALVVPLGDGGVPEGPLNATFQDVPTDHWAYKQVEYCVARGIVQGYDGIHYEPTWTVSRDQMAVYVARAFGLPT